MSFEYRLQQLGRCVNKLHNDAQHLQNLFEICVMDFKESKIRESTIAARIIEKSNKLLRAPITPIRENIVQSERAINLERKILTLANASPNNSSPPDIKIEIPTKLKRSAPEEYHNSLISEDNNNQNNQNNPNNQTKQKKQKHHENTQKKSKRPNRVKSNIKIEAVFSTLSRDEKYRIYYDSQTELGLNEFERKWGVNHKILTAFSKKMNKILNTECSKTIWLESQKSEIDSKFRSLNIEDVRERIKDILEEYNNIYIYPNREETNMQPVGIPELMDLAFERGIAVASARYKVNIYDLEYILQKLGEERWAEMIDNSWYCLNAKGNSQLGDADKLNIARFSEKEGVLHASKKLGIDKNTICKYRKMLWGNNINDNKDNQELV